MGRSIVDIQQTGDLGRNISNIAGSVLGASNPFGSSDIPMAVMPTAGRTPMKLMLNRNHFGGVLVPEAAFYASGKKASSRYDYQASNASIDFAGWVNKFGGDEVRSGYLDFSPNQMETVVDDYGGTFWNAISGSYDIFAYPDDADVTDIPVLGELVNYLTVEEGSSKSELYDLVHKSYSSDPTSSEMKRFNRILNSSFHNGDITLDQAKGLLKTFTKNKQRKQIGDAFNEANEGEIELLLKRLLK